MTIKWKEMCVRVHACVYVYARIRLGITNMNLITTNNIRVIEKLQASSCHERKFGKKLTLRMVSPPLALLVVVLVEVLLAGTLVEVASSPDGVDEPSLSDGAVGIVGGSCGGITPLLSLEFIPGLLQLWTD